MNFIAILCAGWLCLLFLDRLRQINWKTARPLYVLLYLAHVMWALGILYDAFDDGLQWHQWFGMLAQGLWIYVTAHGWLGGVPETVKTEPADLGHPELERLS